LRHDSLLLLFLLIYEVIFVVQLRVELAAYSREFKLVRDFSRLEPGSDLLFEDDQLILHLWIDVPLLLGGPEAPKCIADDVAIGRYLFSAEDVIS